MIHGWGVNSAAFSPLYELLTEYRVHYVDLPGFGLSQPEGNTLDDWVDLLMQQMPDRAIWAGWSLGGLVATQAALRYPERVSALITIASSPCFMQQDSWPGIAPKVLAQFSEQLCQDPAKTIERFLAIQAMGSATAKEDIRQIRTQVLARPLPDNQALALGLMMLQQVDLRSQLHAITQPWLRCWGRLDALVPNRVISQMPALPNSKDWTLAKASHAPFISHTQEFATGLKSWLANLLG